MPRLDCLIVRQPYASLIAFGKKRWEFRRYHVSRRGRIGIAASPNKPWPTLNRELNGILHLFPRGVVLATAELTTSFLVTHRDLEKMRGQPIRVRVHGTEITTLDEPIGEPVEDVDRAIADPGWESFAWRLANVMALDPPMPIQVRSRSTWTPVLMDR